MLVAENISTSSNAPVIILFGGNPHRRDEVINHLKTIGDVTIYGTLSEEEGMNKLATLPKVDLVLIGGKYSGEQRIRIRHFVNENRPDIQISEPGVEYPYENDAILKDIKNKLKI